MKKIVIIGAGYAGVLTAQHLAKKLENTSDVRITLIDKNNYHTMRTEIHAAATGRGKANSIIYDLKDLFKKTSVNLVFDTAIDIDFTGKKVVAVMTHEGSGLGSCERDLKKICAGATFGKGLAVHGADASRSENTVATWAKSVI